METYEIEKQQFNRIADMATSISVPLNAAFALVPVAITLSVTLATVPLAGHTESIIWGLTASFWILGILCSIFAFLQRGQLKRYMQEIRDRQVAPVAAKGASTPTDLTAVADPDASTTMAAAVQEVGDDAL